MPFFKRKSPNSNSNSIVNPEGSSHSNSFARSVEHLIPAFADGRSIQQQSQPHPPPLTPPNYEGGHFPVPDPRFTSEVSGPQRQSQPEVQSQSSLHRSQSQRQPHLQQRDRPTVTVVAPDTQPQPRQKRGLFVRPSSGILDRSSSVSIKGKISHPISHPTSPQVPSNTSDEQVVHHHEDHSPATHSYEPRSTSLAYQQQQQQQNHHHQQHLRQASREQNERSPQSQYPSQQFPAPIDQPYPRPLVRSNTDPNLLGNSSQLSFSESTDEPPHPFESHRGQPHRSQQDLVLNARPPSRQSYEPLSPIVSQTHPDAMQQASAQALPPISNDQPSGSSSRRGSATAHNMPDQPGRQTPTSNRQRADPGDLDFQALLQKHEELQSKYSKVKRYYFDKEAQVQHLQNTVAHQRMAVSRTVLDDNEYANRFQRLDGAIKDLAFSVRKDWRSVPPWLHGLVTDDAVATGTKEMTAMGRAVVSKWLGEEVFHKYFHPGLDSTLSGQLKSIEMNLRRQQLRPCTDEDRENAIARLSNWRRTTFDGLGDALSTPDAQEHRAELIEHLIAELASFLSTQLHEPALPGLEAGVRMIIENTINIAEKIPLEARDVYVEYLPTNITFADAYMKVEGQLPPLAHLPPPPAEQESEDPAAVEEDSSPASNSTGAGEGTSPAPRESKKKSVFDAIRNRKSGGADHSRSGASHPHEEKVEQPEVAIPPRIRFSSFLTVEVRGKGQAMVLVKAPVWLIE
ncbi:hypothetical protein N7533_009019 [Penicillium manginii]|uniref:uncharacterized protein n=1 Tax=Penicillium manginii TaxID=203109 RepID=UPI0025486436|nr:uncharacterized protein N7533_009019 [Penicillium manginii]KAJ5744149.1 hypothetical protein N7533_009019 [Penicillium manginii]